jgi:hypothetical protein
LQLDTYSNYVDPGYVEDGYVFTAKPFILKSSTGAYCQLRGPSGKSGEIVLRQPAEYATGWQRVPFTSRGTAHTMVLDYQRMSDIERLNLEEFFAAVGGIEEIFVYREDLEEREYSVRFDSPELVIREESYDKNSGTIKLWSASSFFILDAGQAVPTINDADVVLTRFSYSCERKAARKQPRDYVSDGNVYIYTKSPIQRQTYRLVMLRRTYAEMAALVFFFSIANGTRTTFPMTFDGSVRTMRFASSSLRWERSPVVRSLYDVVVEVEEDLAI